MRRYTQQKTFEGDIVFGRRFKTTPDGRDVHDKRLSTLLCEWQGLETHPDFEAAVWRRIRTVSVPEPSARSLLGRLCEWMAPHPVWAAAMAVTVAIVIGGLAGFSASTADSSHRASQPLLHPRTLAGSYLYATAGGDR